MSVLLRTEGVRKSYGGVHALDSCTVEIDEGSVRRPDRAERIGQDHAVQRHYRVRQGGRGAGVPG